MEIRVQSRGEWEISLDTGEREEKVKVGSFMKKMNKMNKVKKDTRI